MLEADHTFFEDRFFGPQRRELLTAAITATSQPTGPDRSADIQRLEKEAESLGRRKERLLDQLAAPDEFGDAEIAAEFRRGIRKRFDALEHERRDTLAQIEQYRAESHQGIGPGEVALIDAIPHLNLRFAQLPDNLKRDIFDAFQLRVRYDGRDRGTQLQATITADAVPELVRIGERAAAIAGVVDQPIEGRPRRDTTSGRGRFPRSGMRLRFTPAGFRCLTWSGENARRTGRGVVRHDGPPRLPRPLPLQPVAAG